jgi:hypothetical protein
VQNFAGRLNCRAVFAGSDGAIPVIDGEIVDSVGGRKILSSGEVNNIAGTLNTRVKFEPKKETAIVLGRIVEE